MLAPLLLVAKNCETEYRKISEKSEASDRSSLRLSKWQEKISCMFAGMLALFARMDRFSHLKIPSSILRFVHFHVQ